MIQRRPITPEDENPVEVYITPISSQDEHSIVESVIIDITSRSIIFAAKEKLTKLLNFEHLRRILFHDPTPMPIVNGNHRCSHCTRSFKSRNALTTHSVVHFQNNGTKEKRSLKSLPEVCSYSSLLRPENNKKFHPERAFGTTLFGEDLWMAEQLKWVARDDTPNSKHTFSTHLARDFLRDHLQFISDTLKKFHKEMGLDNNVTSTTEIGQLRQQMEQLKLDNATLREKLTLHWEYISDEEDAGDVSDWSHYLSRAE